jgi:hypothetical protein
MDPKSPKDDETPQPLTGRLLSVFNRVAKTTKATIDEVAKSKVVEGVKDTVKDLRDEKASKREWVGVLKDTAKDLRRGETKELAAFAGAVVIPFGGVGYGAYRLQKYRQKKAANDGTIPEPDASPLPNKDAAPQAPLAKPADTAIEKPAEQPAENSLQMPPRRQRPPRPPRKS